MRKPLSGRSAVLSVVYPEAEPYISEFLSSLSEQTDQDFTLFLINDGLKGLNIFLNKVNFKVQVLRKTGTPAQLRKDGIQWILSNRAEKIIFADSDDYFANNRVEVSKKMLANCDVICNELMLVGEEMPQPIPMLGKFFEDKMKIHKEQIRLSNCMGLSNTAAHAEIIFRYFQLIPNAIIAFDWALFALCIHGGAHTVFTKETKTYYRQHHNNAASPNFFSDQQVMRGIQIKRDHYKLCSHFYKEYAALANSFGNLFMQLRNNRILKQKYCQAVRQHASEVSLWWEPIQSLEELGL